MGEFEGIRVYEFHGYTYRSADPLLDVRVFIQTGFFIVVVFEAVGALVGGYARYMYLG